MTIKVLVALDLNADEKKLYQDIEGIDLTVKSQKDLTKDDVKDCEVIVGNINTSLLAHANNLKFLQLNSAGYDNYLPFVSKEQKLCNCVGAFSPAVGEHMLAMTFSLIRHFHLYRDKQNQKDWSDCGKIISIEGATISVLGLGDIGRSYAKKVKALGAKKVIGVRRNLNDKTDYIDELCSIEDKEKYLGESDIVAMVLPSDKTTQNLINKDTLKMMKKGSYLINVGRGDAIDQDALYEALHSGNLAGAALDVTNPEPLPLNHPLWTEHKLLLTPHVAGWFFLDETKKRIIKISSNNLKAYLNGEKLVNEVQH